MSPFPCADEPITKRQTNSLCYPESRSSCYHTFATSNFYDHCIEQIFPCDQEGFALKYAKKRAEILEGELEIAPELRQYFEKTEICFQEKFRALVESRKTVYPSDESCLALETEAVALLNGCYKQPELCSLVAESDHSEIHAIVKAFRIGTLYHNDTLVNMGLPNAILESCSSNHTELAKSLTTSEMPVRVLICAFSYDTITFKTAFNDTGYIEQLSQALNRSADNFTAFGGDSTTHWCTRVPVQTTHKIFAWFADPQDPLLSQGHEHLFNGEGSFMSNPATYFLQFVETWQDRREHSQCGDGIRQIGETCDPKNNIGNGCLLNCSVHRDYSCSTDTLSPSVCELREEPRLERIPCPTRSRSPSRSRVAHSRRLTMSTGSHQVESFGVRNPASSAISLNSSLVTLLFAVIAAFLSGRF